MSKRRALVFDSAEPPKILVEMEVSRIEQFPKDSAVQVWGHVGDYEVAVTFPTSDGRVKSLVELHRLGEQIERSANPE